VVSAPAGPDGPAEPDYRFTLANERTFLSWMRTGLALVAAGAAVVHLSPVPPVASLAFGAILMALGGLIEASAYRTWRRNDQDIRHGRPLQPSRIPRVVSSSLVVVTVAALLVTLASGPPG
jgi:putative membrane protein